MTMHVRGLLNRDDRAPALARSFVTEVLTEWDRLELIDDAVLLVDELVSNVVEHVDHGFAQIDLRASAEGVRVDVTDPDPDFKIGPEHGSDPSIPRVGLRIVDTLATRWGVLPSASGKSVWFELDSHTEH